MANKKSEVKFINVENPLNDVKENKIILEVTEEDLNNSELEDTNPDDIKSFDEPDQINGDFVSQDEDNILEFYVRELLVSLEGLFIGGHASQKRDQLMSYLYKGNMGGDA